MYIYQLKTRKTRFFGRYKKDSSWAAFVSAVMGIQPPIFSRGFLTKIGIETSRKFVEFCHFGKKS